MESDVSMMVKRRKKEVMLDGFKIEEYDQVIENWLSEEFTLNHELSRLSEPEENISHTEASTDSKKRRFSHINNISKDPTKIRIPRILKSDIRKKYPVMFVNMLNMCDLNLIELFFRKYVNKQDSVVTRCIDFGLKQVNANTSQICDVMGERKEMLRVGEDIIPQNVSFDCLEDVTNFVILMTMLSPDRYIRMKRAEVITRSDTFKTVIHIYFELHGTRITHWTPIEVGHFLLSLRSRPFMTREDLVQQFEETLPRLEASVPLHVEGKFTLNIDNNDRDDLRISNIISDVVLLS